MYWPNLKSVAFPVPVAEIAERTALEMLGRGVLWAKGRRSKGLKVVSSCSQEGTSCSDTFAVFVQCPCYRYEPER